MITKGGNGKRSESPSVQRARVGWDLQPFGLVAQSVEHWFEEPGVAGSIPAQTTTMIPPPRKLTDEV